MDSKFGSFGVSDSGYEYFARPQWRLVEVPYGGFVLRAHRRPFDTGIRLTRTPTHDSILFSFLLSLLFISSRSCLLFYGTLVIFFFFFFSRGSQSYDKNKCVLAPSPICVFFGVEMIKKMSLTVIVVSLYFILRNTNFRPMYVLKDNGNCASIQASVCILWRRNDRE